MNILALNCSSESFLSLLGLVSDFARIGIVLMVVLLIIFTMIGFMKTVMSDKADNGAEIKMMFKKFLSVILVFLMVPIVIFIINLINSVSPLGTEVKTCIDVITDSFLTGSTTAPVTEEPQTFESRCTDNGGTVLVTAASAFNENMAGIIDTERYGNMIKVCFLTE